jgi:hypothetical protein
MRVLHRVRVGIEVVLAGIEGRGHPELSLHVWAWIHGWIVVRIYSTVVRRLRRVLSLHSLVDILLINKRVNVLLRWVCPLHALRYWRPMVVEHNIIQLFSLI